ncbi:MAG: hypothetical protein RI841_14205, partial [Halomonas sp.]|uniref:hypothetical protein n=1 Tax=Halomonas sp. TaxID=1486246 RepID=UPI00287047C7
ALNGTAHIHQDQGSQNGNVYVEGDPSFTSETVYIQDQVAGTVTTDLVEDIFDVSGEANTIVATNDDDGDVNVDATDDGLGDTITVTDAEDVRVDSGEGDDNIRIGSVINTLAGPYDVEEAVVFAGDGNDVIDVYVSIDAGVESVSDGEVADGSDADEFTADDDGINGGAGNDTITVVANDDALVRGDAGDDRIDILADEQVYVVGGTGSGTRDYTVGTFGNYITVEANDDVFVAAGDAGDYIDIVTHDLSSDQDVNVEDGNGDDTIIIDTDSDVTINIDTTGTPRNIGGDGNDTIEVDFGDGSGNTAEIFSGAGNDTITVNTFGSDTAEIITGLGGASEGDTVNLAVSLDGGEDTVVFGTIVYDGLQDIDATTTQNFSQKALQSGSGQPDGTNVGEDTIIGFNFENPNGAGAEDKMDFNEFYASTPNSTAGPDDASDLRYADWEANPNQDVVLGGGDDAAIIRVGSGFTLDASSITSAASGTGQVQIDDNDGAVVLTAFDNSGDGNIDTVDAFFVQDTDGGTGQAWAVDHVATFESATEIGALQTIDIANFA